MKNYMEDIIQIRGIGKRYRLGAQKGLFNYKTMRGALTNVLKVPTRIFRSPASNNEDLQYFWALKDVSFDVKRGEVLGVIGRNGAGKTTLLKILSQITEPTEGEIRIKGKVASLLEVGTGFHPELSGRENIFMNGAILGMTRAEVKRKFDEIVEFAELEKFIDTPVKRYSSGMYVRLAFSIAGHLEPDILLVDEVLAVGDAGFQKKCLGKMEDVTKKEGRTVLFVSHNMSAINALCNRCVLLDKGKVIMNGRTAEVTAYYHSSALSAHEVTEDLRNLPRTGTGRAKFTSIKIQGLSENNEVLSVPVTGKNIMIETTVEAHEEINEANLAIIIYDSNGYRLIDVNTALKGKFISIPAGKALMAKFILYNVLLKPSTYLVGLWVGKGGVEEYDHIEYAVPLNIVDAPSQTKHVEVFPGHYVCMFDVITN